MSSRATLPFSRSLTAAYTVAPVAERARAVSIPIPEEQPVMKATLPWSFPSRPSSWMIWRAVGRASPGPLVEAWAAAYLEVMASF